MRAPKSSSKAFRLTVGILLLWIGAAFGTQPSLAAQLPVSLSDLKAEYIFGEVIVFSVQVQADAPIQKVEVFFKSAGETDTLIRQALLDEKGLASYTHDLISQPLRSFTQVAYWFQVTLQNGEITQSEQASIYYEDSRFEWQSLADNEFEVFWYEGDTAFGQGLLDAAQAGLERAQNLLPITPTAPVKIYVYATALEMQSTLQLGKISWVRGHATPDLGVMVVSLPDGPDQRIETRRQIPHELMHILLYQRLEGQYSNLPVWLSEGLASLAELERNPDYATMLNLANKKNTLLPLASLCTAIPLDASGAFLAYAEAEGVTRFLFGQFGREGMDALVEAYGDGLSCERGVEAGLGLSLERLENQWLRATFGDSLLAKSAANLLPWAGLMLAALVAPLLAMAANLRRRKPLETKTADLPEKTKASSKNNQKGTGR